MSSTNIFLQSAAALAMGSEKQAFECFSEIGAAFGGLVGASAALPKARDHCRAGATCLLCSGLKTCAKAP